MTKSHNHKSGTLNEAGLPRPWSRIVTHSLIFLVILTLYSSSGTRVHNQGIESTAEQFLSTPIEDADFVGLADRLQEIQTWHDKAASMRGFWRQSSRNWLNAQVDRVLTSTLPFLAMTEESPHAFSNIRDHHRPGTEGIVICMHSGSIRFGAHVLANLKRLNNTLPIEIAYAGDGDLPLKYRKAIRKITSGGPPVRFLDVLKVLDDESIELTTGGWAVKAYAALASRFEKVMVLDADTFFFQPPHILADYVKKHSSLGAFLFHDRLMWQNLDSERHQWYRSMFGSRPPTEALQKSRVYHEGYSEEADSGVVFLDKSYSAVLFGLLHICWQNSKTVRDTVTYRKTHGDKESWWIGLELVGAPYSFNDDYAAVLGEVVSEPEIDDSVCSKAISHIWESANGEKRLFWLNGSILKDKHEEPDVYIIPTTWAYNGTWQTRGSHGIPVCMVLTEIRQISSEEHDILSLGVADALDIDDDFAKLLNLQ